MALPGATRSGLISHVDGSSGDSVEDLPAVPHGDSPDASLGDSLDDALGTSLGDSSDVKLVSISVDPVKDTPDVLKVYADRFKAGPNWYFCTGDKDAIVKLAHDGFKLPIAEGTPESGPITHTTRLTLVDKTGTARGFYEGTSEEGVRDIVRDIHRLLEEK